MHARPRAKVNLTLSVGPRGRDGYHPIASLVLRVGLADELTVAFAPEGGADVLTVTGLPGSPVRGNLVVRAFSAGRAALGVPLPPLVAHLDKRIPVGGGLGGGSADAASALDCALQMWGVGLSRERLNVVAADLGSDVPFFASGATLAWVTGRGESVERLPPPDGQPGILLVTPAFSLSTAEVFARFDELSQAPRELPASPPDGPDLAAAAERLRDANDLWPAASSVAPQLGTLRDALEARTGQPWLLSGSGSTLFALYASATAATEAGRSIAAAELDELRGATINAVDLVGPDSLWRYPWPSEQ
jgi:4-diphosphocytidyl-2-C-methyl-D-erythritol kinase